jgi:hypothetical protein
LGWICLFDLFVRADRRDNASLSLIISAARRTDAPLTPLSLLAVVPPLARPGTAAQHFRQMRTFCCRRGLSVAVAALCIFGDLAPSKVRRTAAVLTLRSQRHPPGGRPPTFRSPGAPAFASPVRRYALGPRLALRQRVSKLRRIAPWRAAFAPLTGPVAPGASPAHDVHRLSPLIACSPVGPTGPTRCAGGKSHPPRRRHAPVPVQESKEWAQEHSSWSGSPESVLACGAGRVMPAAPPGAGARSRLSRETLCCCVAVFCCCTVPVNGGLRISNLSL